MKRFLDFCRRATSLSVSSTQGIAVTKPHTSDEEKQTLEIYLVQAPWGKEYWLYWGDCIEIHEDLAGTFEVAEQEAKRMYGYVPKSERGDLSPDQLFVARPARQDRSLSNTF